MPRPARTIPTIVFFLLALGASVSAEQVNQLKPNGFVNDYANVLDPESVRQMQFLCAQVNQKADAQIAVVTIKSLDGMTIEAFANRLFKKWGIGPKKNNHGVLVLLSVGDRKYRIEVGRGLEAVVTNRKAAAFGREAVPYLKDIQYGTALLMMTQRITDAIAADAQVKIPAIPPAPAPTVNAAAYSYSGASSSGGGALAGMFIIAIIVIFVVIIVAAAGRNTTWSGGGGYYHPYYGYPSGGYVHVVHHYYGGFGGTSSGSSWSGGGGFGGGGGFSGFGGGDSGGSGASGDYSSSSDDSSSSSSSSSDSSSSSSSSSFGGGDSGGGGASGDF